MLFNGVIDPTPATVTRLASLDLLERAVPTLLKYLGRANLEQLANTAARNGIGFRSQPSQPASQSQSLLGDEAWLGQLFDFGFANGKAGIWQNTPR